MQRYNIFYQIHKALRQMLYHAASLQLQTDFTNATDTRILLKQMNTVLELFDEHAHTEDNSVLSSITAFEPSAVNLFEEEHLQDHALSNRLRALLNMFHHTVSSEEKNELGSAIRLAFTEFLVFNLKHMAKEENYLNKLLWNYYSDEQLHGITAKILAHLPPRQLRQYNIWMMRAFSNDEIAGWLNVVQKEAPAFIFNDMILLAENELTGDR